MSNGPGASGGGQPQGDYGDRGGTGTLGGVDFQIAVATRLVLEGIATALDESAAHPHVTVEAIDADGGSKWDIDTGDRLIETKLVPTPADVREWLQRCARTPRGGLELHYSRASTRLVRDLARLIVWANDLDCAGFERVAAGKKAFQGLVAVLGDDAYSCLRRLRIVNTPEEYLKDDTRRLARDLVGEARGDRLVEMITARLLAGASTRKRHSARDVIRAAEESGLPFRATRVEGGGPSTTTRRQIQGLLEACPKALPVTIVCGAVGVSTDELTEILSDTLAAGAVVLEAGLIRREPCGGAQRISTADANPLIDAALERLLRHISEHNSAPSVGVQVENAVALSSRAGDGRVVAGVFRVLDKHLKDRGDPTLVFQVAERSSQAASQMPAPRTDEVTQAWAVALICGTSWALQRVDRLDAAFATGDESLRLGMGIGWTRNTAFCHKCLGRLARLQAGASHHDRDSATVSRPVEKCPPFAG